MTRRQILSKSILPLVALPLFSSRARAKSTNFAVKTRCGQFENEEPFVENLVLGDNERSIHENYIKQAIELSRSAENHCNHPFGALLVHEDKIILKSENRVNTDADPTQHAEYRLVSEASRAQHIDGRTLKKSTLYTSAEPCAMCCGAIFWSGIRTVVYSAPHDSFGSGSFRAPSREVFKFARRSKVSFRDHSVVVVGPILEQESIPIVKEYFSNLVGEKSKECKIKFNI